MNSDLLRMTPDVRCDLWRYFGETLEDAERLGAGSWPSLPETTMDYRGAVKLRLDTPFGRAFAAWRQEHKASRSRAAPVLQDHVRTYSVARGAYCAVCDYTFEGAFAKPTWCTGQQP